MNEQAETSKPLGIITWQLWTHRNIEKARQQSAQEQYLATFIAGNTWPSQKPQFINRAIERAEARGFGAGYSRIKISQWR